MRWFCVFVMGVVLARTAGAQQTPWATRDHYGSFQIVVAENASESEAIAAATLRRYWEAVTGHELPTAHAPTHGPFIWIGFDSVPTKYLGDVDPDGFGEQELWLKSFEADGQPQLIIAGGPRRGTLYGVYQFLEDRLGVRWLAPGVTHVPDAPAAISSIDYRYEPIFEYRWSTYLNNVEDREGLAEYRDVHRWLAGPSFRCHTFYRYVPPEEYFQEHPEYFSLVNGKRVAPTYNWHDHTEHRNRPGEQGQLCMTNPGVLDVIYDRIVADIAANPEERVHHVSQMDWNYYCECETCRAIDEREETHMGSVLWGLNRIAGRLAEEHADHRIETLAYTYTRTPPRHMKPHDNVIIKLCSIEADFSRPFNDPGAPLNRAFALDVEGWSKIAPRLHVWDYLTNFNNFQSPMPNFHVIQPNMQFLAEHRVKGMFPQGAYDDIAEFALLRAYVLSKLMWNPYCDVQAVMDDFINLYYREAAPFVTEYIALLTESQQAEGMPLTCFDRGLWYDYDTVEEAKELFERVFDAVESEEGRQRIKVLYATVQYAAFKCPPKVEITGDTITVRRPESQTFDEYFAMLKNYNIKNINDYFALDSFVEQTGGKTPPRLRQSPLETLENNRYLLWIAPALDGSVIRWYDKQLDLELLRGYQEYGKIPGTWEDWVNTPGVPEHPAAGEYEVVAKQGNRITLRAHLETGAVIERMLRLTDDGAVEVSLAFINESDKPLRPSVKVHPEFYTQGTEQPEIWGEQAGQWVCLTEGVRPEDTVHGTSVPAAGFTRLAARLPKAQITIVSVFDPDGVGNLLYFFNVNPDAQHVNLELLPQNNTMLQPGERSVIRGTYRLTREAPDEL